MGFRYYISVYIYYRNEFQYIWNGNEGKLKKNFVCISFLQKKKNLSG